MAGDAAYLERYGPLVQHRDSTGLPLPFALVKKNGKSVFLLPGEEPLPPEDDATTTRADESAGDETSSAGSSTAVTGNGPSPGEAGGGAAKKGRTSEDESLDCALPRSTTSEPAEQGNELFSGFEMNEHSLYSRAKKAEEEAAVDGSSSSEDEVAGEATTQLIDQPAEQIRGARESNGEGSVIEGAATAGKDSEALVSPTATETEDLEVLRAKALASLLKKKANPAPQPAPSSAVVKLGSVAPARSPDSVGAIGTATSEKKKKKRKTRNADKRAVQLSRGRREPVPDQRWPEHPFHLPPENNNVPWAQFLPGTIAPPLSSIPPPLMHPPSFSEIYADPHQEAFLPPPFPPPDSFWNPHGYPNPPPLVPVPPPPPVMPPHLNMYEPEPWGRFNGNGPLPPPPPQQFPVGYPVEQPWFEPQPPPPPPPPVLPQYPHPYEKQQEWREEWREERREERHEERREGPRGGSIAPRPPPPPRPRPPPPVKPRAPSLPPQRPVKCTSEGQSECRDPYCPVSHRELPKPRPKRTASAAELEDGEIEDD